ncbi:MAG: RMD1 family protein [Patescibacteria group bacterium]
MVNKTQHRFVSVSFRENFVMANLPAEWNGSTHITDSKDSKAKDVLGGGVVFAYRFGALTFIDADPGERSAEINSLKQQLGLDLNARVTTEEFFVEEIPEEKPRVEYHRLVLDKLTPERKAVIAKIIAQSAAMECYEQLIDAVKVKVDVMVDRLEETGKIGMSPEKLYKTIGYAIAIRNEVIGMLHLLDKPDLIWEDKIMDSLYDELRSAFDLNDRFKALEYKLKVIQETLDILADTVKDRRGYRVDVAITALIVFEIILTLCAHFHLFGW